PQLLVVGIHEVALDAVAEAPGDPAPEVAGRGGLVLVARVPRLDVALQALELRLLRQIAEAVLEGVVHEAVAEADLRVPVAVHEGLVAARAVLHPLHHRAVLAEEDVPARDVVGEAVDRLRAAQSSDDAVALEERQVRERESVLAEGPR